MGTGTVTTTGATTTGRACRPRSSTSGAALTRLQRGDPVGRGVQRPGHQGGLDRTGRHGCDGVLQIFIVAISGSIALLADTLHNVGHAATTIPLIVAFRIGQRTATKRYSYGYRRAEDLVGLFISLIIALSAGLIIWESVDALVNPREITNLRWVFAAGLVGAGGNELVAIYRIRAGRRIGSAALIAEGQHVRADGFTSIAAVVGVIGVWLGIPQADASSGSSSPPRSCGSSSTRCGPRADN